jgi:hypothetical protein
MLTEEWATIGTEVAQTAHTHLIKFEGSNALTVLLYEVCKYNGSRIGGKEEEVSELSSKRRSDWRCEREEDESTETEGEDEERALWRGSGILDY